MKNKRLQGNDYEKGNWGGTMPDMEISKYAKNYGVEESQVRFTLQFLPKDAKTSFGGVESIDTNYHDEIMNIIENYDDFLKKESDRQKMLESFVMTSGFNIEGHRIIKYQDFIASEVVLGMGMFKSLFASISNLAGTESESLNTKLKEGREIVKNRIKAEAISLGCNAIIGLDIDITMFGDTLLGIVANGTAVLIEPVIDSDR